MIVRQFIRWIRTAPADERAEATRALARAWLISDLSEDDRTAAEGALLMLLDDPSPLVRQAMADVFARSAEAPAAIVQALSLDQPSIALPVLEHSPLLIDADLVDIVATGNNDMQCAIARRINLPASVCAAIAEVGSPAAALELIENAQAELPPFSWDRIVERHGHLAAIREAMLMRRICRPRPGWRWSQSFQIHSRNSWWRETGSARSGQGGSPAKRASAPPSTSRRAPRARTCGAWSRICAPPASSPPA
jgi:uncharacterized protein (DUF2336 family)